MLVVKRKPEVELYILIATVKTARFPKRAAALRGLLNTPVLSRFAPFLPIGDGMFPTEPERRIWVIGGACPSPNFRRVDDMSPFHLCKLHEFSTYRLSPKSL